ncbi:MAG: L-seryl-tRNA(Sec) selenium transferase [Actinomycetota bacterium]
MRPPSVDRLARSLTDVDLPHPLLVEAARAAIAAGDPDSARERAERLSRALLRPVVNATGVLLHTNLGRAPVGHDQHAGYANLELDLATGKRGSRSAHVASLLARASEAEAALVVNNCAAAVLLGLTAVASGRGVVVSRGELVEIGGGFRVPDVMAQSGAALVEVGTTNRTRLADYRRAVDAPEHDVAALLKVHTSNYRVMGFTEDVSIRALAGLELPVLADIGSGLLDAGCPWLRDGPPSWLGDEPAVRQTLAEGADLVMFSCDKLLGGPQAGVIAGRADLVAACAQHPLARAMRPGGLVLAALQDLLLAYLRKDGDAIPFWRMVQTPVERLQSRAESLGVGEPIACESVTGGGTLPDRSFPSFGIAVDGDITDPLRESEPAIIARVQDGRTFCDLRTVDPTFDDHLAKAVAAAI